MICDSFASLLRSGRPDFNVRFAEARRQYPDLNGQEFAAFLETRVDPIVRAVEQKRPDRAGTVVSAAYDLALELIGQKLAGAEATQSFIDELWQKLLPTLPESLAADPGRIMAGFCNVVHNLTRIPGARPSQWLEEMSRLGPMCSTDVEACLKCGQILAWRAGMAHHRAGALAVAGTLSGSLALAAVGAPASASWPTIRQHLAEDLWFDPSQPAVPTASRSELRVVAQAGAFRGFGGSFDVPPLVTSAGDHFLVSGNEECWLLTADIFGATFHRATPEEFASAQSAAKLPPDLKVNGSVIQWRGKQHDMGWVGSITSAAANQTTLAFTSALTHTVTLAALT